MSSGLNWVVGRSDGVVMSLVTSTTAFAGAARDFVDEMAALGIDVRDDAVELARGAIDVDGFLTNEELAAFIVTFESMRSDLVGARPEDLRREGVFQGGRRSLTHPSSAFIAAVERDRRDGRGRARRYADLATEMLRAIAALDDHVSNVELNTIDGFRRMLQGRIDAAPTPPAGEIGHVTPLQDALDDLDGLIGLRDVKRRVAQMTDLLRIRNLRSAHGLTNPELTHHMAFVGNPGTGKTTVARLLGRVFAELGVLEHGRLVEVDRAALVAGYVGQTAAKVDEVVASAIGGVLLVDEAYSLTRGDDGYGAEAVDALVKRMEDHRHELVVILTGYPDEMDHLLTSNPGLASRLGRTIGFADYDDEELYEILDRFVTRADYCLDDAAARDVRSLIATAPRDRSFGNGRWARQRFDEMVLLHAERVAGLSAHDVEVLSLLNAEDVPAG